MARVQIPQAQNLLLSSEDFDSADWTAENLTGVTADAGAGPFGGSNADDLVDTAANVNHDVYQTPSIPIGSTACLSVWAKPLGEHFLLLWYDGFSGMAWFDVQAGTVGTVGSGATGRVVRSLNGFYLCSVSWTQTNASGGVVIASAHVDAGFNYVGAGAAALRLWGASLSLANHRGDYRRTLGAAVNTGPLRNV